MKYLSKSEQDTEKAAENLASALPGRAVIFLTGPLGAGKTVFARALIRALLRDTSLTVPSPTFTLLQTYEGPLWHFDLYRLEKPEEIYELGWEEALADGIALVEWPERLESFAPSSYIEIAISPLAEAPNHREITVTAHGTFEGTL